MSATLSAGGHPGDAHVDLLAAERDTLRDKTSTLPRSLGQRAIGANDTPPRQVGLVDREQDRAGEAGRARRDVAVGADEAGGNLAHPFQDFELGASRRAGQAAGPKASMIRFWYSLSSSGEMK
jgi:hypothetical protein